MEKFRTYFFYLVLCLFGSLLIRVPAYAQNPNTITVTPQLYRLDLTKDEPEAEFIYTNGTNKTVELTLSMQDVKELEDRGIPDLLDQSESKNYKYGLSSWASFSSKSVVIAPNESKTITVFIDKERLSRGGHYAAVLAEVVQNVDGKPVKLRAIISSLLFVRAGTGFEDENAVFLDLQANRKLLDFPSSVAFKLQNLGNVDLTPYGTVMITDNFGKTVARGIINEDSLITLPESTRKYTVNFNPTKGFLLPGIYKMSVSANYGRQKQKKELSASFWTLGSIHTGIVSLSLFVVIGGLIGAVKLRGRRNKPE